MTIDLTPPPDKPRDNDDSKIKLPEDAGVTKTLLENKLAEYKKRKQNLDTFYRIEILNWLMNHGEVSINEILKKLGNVDREIFDNAIGVIEDYISTGGKNNEGGTGLKSKEALILEIEREALGLFPNNLSAQDLFKKKKLGEITDDEDIVLRAMMIFPTSNRGQELTEREIRGTITEKEKLELKRCKIFPDDSQARDLLRDDELGTIHREEGIKLKELILGELRQDGMLLEYVSPRLRDDKVVVLRAIEQNPRAIDFASDRLQVDADIKKAAGK